MAIVFTKEQYRQLVKKDFWTKIELYFVLFGDEHPILRDDSVPLIIYDYKDPTFIGPHLPDPFVNLSFHGPITSDKIPDPNVLMNSVRHNRVQSLMDSIDDYIDDYVQLEKLIKTPNTIHRKIKTLRNPYVFSINETGYQAIKLFELLGKKQVVVISPQLIKFMKEGPLDMAASLLLELHENMIYLLNHGGSFVDSQEETTTNTPNLKVDQESEVKLTKKLNKRHSESREHKAKIREIANELWINDKTLTIQDLIDSDEINLIIKSNGKNYSEKTLRNYIKDLAPSNKPGRRPKKY